MYQQLKERGYAASVDMLMDLELLSKKIMSFGEMEKFHI